jgi:hypothetical protein
MRNETSADATLGEFLDRIAGDPALEMEWVELLSQLEYVGCRKIVKSVGFERVSLEVLRHVAEEASHALLLKSVAERGGRAGRSWREGRFCEAGWRYFQGLDRGISALSEDASLHYPGVAWAVERRVLEVYPEYAARTRNEDVRKALRRILVQEERHGAQFERSLFPAGYRDKAIALEETLWRRFLAEARALL